MLNEGKDELVNHDQRILKRKLLQGEISEREVQNFCKNIPDVSDNVEEVSFEEDQK